MARARLALLERAEDDPEQRSKAEAEGSLAEYVKQAWGVVEPSTAYLHNWHIDCICEHLEAVTDGSLTRLIVNMPPRYGKSGTIAVAWPTWEWLREPGQRWMFVSYSSQLSTTHSVNRRAVIQSEWYQGRWGDKFSLTTDQNVKSYFRNTAGGTMLATSVGAFATGLGGNRLVVDDIHDPKEAESEAERQAGIDFFDRTLYSRLDDKKKGAIVVVMQRLHQEDLTGHLLGQGGWEHLKLPGEARERTVVRFPRSGREVVREQGEPLWPEREGRPELDRARIALTAYGYAGQYDQEPAPPGGGLFRREWFPVAPTRPQYSKIVRYWDKAGTDAGGAYTAGVKIGHGVDGLFYVLDVVRGQWAAATREAMIRQTAEKDGPYVEIWIEQEPGSGGKESAQYTLKNLAGFNVHAEPATGDKVTRARPWASQCGSGGEGKEGNVRLKAGDWNAAFIDEHAIFPNGRYKDQVDAASGAFNKLALRPPPSRIVGGGGVAELGGRVYGR